MKNLMGVTPIQASDMTHLFHCYVHRFLRILVINPMNILERIVYKNLYEFYIT
jgi:hypothetical protein